MTVVAPYNATTGQGTGSERSAKRRGTRTTHLRLCVRSAGNLKGRAERRLWSGSHQRQVGASDSDPAARSILAPLPRVTRDLAADGLRAPHRFQRPRRPGLLHRRLQVRPVPAGERLLSTLLPRRGTGEALPPTGLAPSSSLPPAPAPATSTRLGDLPPPDAVPAGGIERPGGSTRHPFVFTIMACRGDRSTHPLGLGTHPLPSSVCPAPDTGTPTTRRPAGGGLPGWRQARSRVISAGS